MNLPKSTASARITPFVATVLLCLGAFLNPQQLAQPTIGSETPATPAAGRSAQTGTAQLVDGYTSAGSPLVTFVEEVGPEDKQPVNAEYLTLLLTVFYFGCILGLVFGGRIRDRDDALLLAFRRLPSLVPRPARVPTASLLSVFRL